MSFIIVLAMFIKRKTSFGKKLLLGLVCIVSTACMQLEAQIAHLPENIQQYLRQTWPMEKITSKSYYLSVEQHKQMLAQTRQRHSNYIHTFYRTYNTKNGRIKNYGIFDTHLVRTKSQTLFLVLNNKGKLEKINVIAFHEPDEYKPPQRWLDQFPKYNKKGIDSLRYKVDGLSGATLTRNAVIGSVTKTILLYKLHLEKK